MLKNNSFRWNILFLLSFIFLLSSCGVKKSLEDKPDLSAYSDAVPQREKINDSTYFAGDNFLTKNKYGLWELYVEGDPLQRGLLTGSLTEELFNYQEQVFLDKIYDLVPSKGQRNFLTKFIRWFNRKMYTYIPNEYKAEIFGVSQFADPAYNDFAPQYLRVLYMHGAHDIGHALQDLMLVGCSSFAVWGDKTADDELLLARNFDFYAGDEFAKNKIIAFYAPDEGNKFMQITWGGFLGVVSGMNDAGLTVTINAGKSKIPLIAKTPITLVTREILQHASTIDEAIAIAKKREVFVSESIMVGSANERRAVLIEVSPKNFGVYEVPNNDELLCTNHFQSEVYKDDRRNQKTIAESHTEYRFERLTQLVDKEDKMTPEKAVAILRDTKGIDGEPLGYGNEKALNQLLAHHGIVFKPEERKVWVSANPYQLGAFVCYDLDAVFANRAGNPSATTLADDALTIARDPFVETQEFKDYEAYRKLEREVEQTLEQNEDVEKNVILALAKNNPEYWKAYFLTGKYYFERGWYAAALKQFEIANTKVVTTVPDQKMLDKYIKKSKRRSGK